jgi:hypothetical protein
MTTPPYGNQDTSSSESYQILFSTHFRDSLAGGNLKKHTRLLFRKVGYARCHVPCLVQRMDFMGYIWYIRCSVVTLLNQWSRLALSKGPNCTESSSLTPDEANSYTLQNVIHIYNVTILCLERDCRRGLVWRPDLLDSLRRGRIPPPWPCES